MNGEVSEARTDRPACHSILMVGTHLQATGGVRAVVHGYVEAGLFRRYPGVYVQTHHSGGRLRKAYYALRGYLEVAWHLLTLDAPLVHIHMASRASFWRKSIVCFMARARGRPYILHLHGAEFAQFYQDECGPREQRFIRSIFEHAALVIALSDEWRQRVLRICPGATVEVLPNAVELPDARLLNAPQTNVPTVLFLGSLGRRKGTYDLVRAFAQIADEFPTARLLLGGDGDIAHTRALAEQLGISGRVECLGWMGAAEKPRAFAAATVFALPSYAEGLPMALLEAMSFGLPVLTTPVGGIPQLVKHDENGWLIQPGHIDELAAALRSLLASPGARARLGTAARTTIQNNFTLDRALERLGELYGRFGLGPHQDGTQI
jgi:glycosyltransferase involved in cell wall biosynthesis